MGGAAAGAGIQAAAGHVDQLIGFGLNAMAASKSWDRQKNLMTRGYLYKQEGLEKAGLNRILALGAGAAGGAMGGAPQAHAPGKGPKIDNPMIAKLQGENLAANTAKALSEGRIANAQADITEANAIFRTSSQGREIYLRSLQSEAEPKTIPQVGSKFLTNALEAWKNRRKGTAESPWLRRIDDPRAKKDHGPRFEDPSGRNWGRKLKATDMRKK